MLCSKRLRHEERGRLARWIDDSFKRLEAWYARRLDTAIERPLIPVAAVGGLLAVAGVLFLTPESELTPAAGVGFLSANDIVPLGPGYEHILSDVRPVGKARVSTGGVRWTPQP